MSGLSADLAEVEEGVANLLDAYIGVRRDDFVLIAYTPDSREYAAILTVELRRRSIEAAPIWMLPLADKDLPERLRQTIPSDLPPARRLVIVTLERDTMSHTDMLRGLVKSYGCSRTVTFRAIGASRELFATALRASPGELSHRNSTLLARLMTAKTMRIRTEEGTDLRVTLDQSRYRWISNRGVARPGSFVVLPAGEVATFPAQIDGRLVANFALHINCVTSRDCRLSNRPVSVEIVDGVAVGIETRDRSLGRFIGRMLSVPHGRRVGELGFGTNPRVRTPLRHNSHINERCPGVHIGLGQHNQHGAVSYLCPVHLDLIARGGRLWVDESSESLDLDRLEGGQLEHPNDAGEEDVFAPDSEVLESDCCGVN